MSTNETPLDLGERKRRWSTRRNCDAMHELSVVIDLGYHGPHGDTVELSLHSAKALRRECHEALDEIARLKEANRKLRKRNAFLRTW